MSQEKEGFLPSNKPKKKKFLYLDRFESYSTAVDKRLNAMENAIRFVHLVLALVAIVAIVGSIWYGLSK